MSTVDEIYGSDNWLRAPDLNGQEWKLRIEAQEVVEFKQRDGTQKRQVAVKFFGAKKRLGINKTNAKRLEKMFGGNPAIWVGQEITLYVVETQDADGNATEGIRVREMPAPALPPQAAVSSPQTGPRLLKEFTQQESRPQYTERNPPPPSHAPDDMNDQVPF